MDRDPVAPVRPLAAALKMPPEPNVLQADSPISISRMIARLNEQIDEDTIVIADIGDALFGATELTIRGRTEFISPAYYTSMGFSVPAALGAQIAQPERRVVVLVGDGAFQMTGMELSTIVRHGFDPIVIVQDNAGYGTERFLHAGDWAYNDIHPWRYHKLPELLGGGRGYEVRTEGDFDRALSEAWNDRSQASLIQVHLDRKDASNALHRLADRLSKKI
jgi:indolepyruvate decarboxylase